MAAVVNLLSLYSILLSIFASPATISARLVRPKTNLKNVGGDIDGVVVGLATRERESNELKLREKSKLLLGERDSREKEVLDLEQKLCQPYPSIVKVEEPGIRGRFYWPNFVELHRCVGGCYITSELAHCKVTDQENVAFTVEDIVSDLKLTISMPNHTACSCACKKEECSERQQYNEDKCTCECIENERKCENEVNKRWDEQSCQCECNTAPKHCTVHGEKWSDDSCQCEPDDFVSA